MKINKILLILGIIVIFMSFLYARTYSNRAIETTDQIIVTDSDGNDYLNKWSQVATFAEDNIDTISGDLVLSDSVYIGGNLKVDGVIYGYDAYVQASLANAVDTVATDTTVVDSADIYRTVDASFNNRTIYGFTATDSGIVYTGEATRIFEIRAAITYETDKNNNFIYNAIEVNDTLCTCSQSIYKTKLSGDYAAVPFLVAAELETGDRVELVVKSNFDATTIIWHTYNVSIDIKR